MKIIFFAVALLFSSGVHARFGGKLGFYATLNGSLDFVEFKKPAVDDVNHKGTGFGLEVAPGIRFGSSIALGPFAIFSSISDSNDDKKNYLLSGYGGLLKIRFAPINFKGGYGFYFLDETIDDFKTSYKNASGWHAGIGFEALLGPGLTISLDGKYQMINFTKHGAELTGTSIILGVTSYF